MPFKKFPDTSLPLPTVEMRFKGLLVVNPADDKKKCQVGIHRLGDDHFPVIEIRGKTRAGRDFLVARLLGPLPSPLTIGLDPRPANSYVYAFWPAPRPFNRSTDHHDTDLGWAVDLQEPKHFHNEKLQMFSPGVGPYLEISDAVFFSGHLTDKTEVVVKVEGPNGVDDLHRIASVICASISLPNEGHRVLISGGGIASPIILPRSGDEPDTLYTVSVRNEPLSIGLEDEPTHEELDQYYEVIRKLNGTIVPIRDRFRIKMSSVVHPRLTDEIPCMPVGNGGGP